MTADTTKVAMNPAITPFIELDMAISQIGSAGDRERLNRPQWNCVPLSQPLHAEVTTRFSSYAACAIPDALLARHHHPHRPQGRRGRRRRRWPGFDRPD